MGRLGQYDRWCPGPPRLATIISEAGETHREEGLGHLGESDCDQALHQEACDGIVRVADELEHIVGVAAFPNETGKPGRAERVPGGGVKRRNHKQSMESNSVIEASIYPRRTVLWSYETRNVCLLYSCFHVPLFRDVFLFLCVPSHKLWYCIINDP